MMYIKLLQVQDACHMMYIEYIIHVTLCISSTQYVSHDVYRVHNTSHDVYPVQDTCHVMYIKYTIHVIMYVCNRVK